jgi:hypothetical protein
MRLTQAQALASRLQRCPRLSPPSASRQASYQLDQGLAALKRRKNIRQRSFEPREEAPPPHVRKSNPDHRRACFGTRLAQREVFIFRYDNRRSGDSEVPDRRVGSRLQVLVGDLLGDMSMTG